MVALSMLSTKNNTAHTPLSLLLWIKIQMTIFSRYRRKHQHCLWTVPYLQYPSYPTLQHQWSCRCKWKSHCNLPRHSDHPEFIIDGHARPVAVNNARESFSGNKNTIELVNPLKDYIITGEETNGLYKVSAYKATSYFAHFGSNWHLAPPVRKPKQKVSC